MSTTSPRQTGIIIRPATDRDVDVVAAIYTHHVLYGTATFETEPPTSDEMHRRREDVVARGLPYLIAAAQDGTVLGYAYATAYRPRPAYRNTVENSIYVRQDMTGRGIGRHLLEALITECQTRGLRQMVAVVGDSANLPSIHLHEAFGFRRVGVLRSVGRKHGRWLDTVLLQRPLGEGETSPPVGE